MTAKIVGRVVAGLVKDKLVPGRTGGTPKIVLSSFSEPEVAAMIEVLEGHRIRGAKSPVEIVVAADGQANELPPEVLLAENRTLAWHRNNSDSGLVLIQLVPTSDEGSLRQMYRITDVSVLDQADPEAKTKVLREIALAAWKQASEAVFPELLDRELTRVFMAVTKKEPLALRRWTTFVVAVVRGLAESGGAIDEASVRATLGAELPALDLFPHLRLFDDDARVERALERNRYLSEGRNPTGGEAKESFLLDRIQRLEHRAADGSTLNEDDVAILRQNLVQFTQRLDPNARRRIDFVQFERLFDSGSARRGLGRTVREELAQTGPAELETFQELEIEGALEDNDHDAAAALLETTTESGALLVDSLTPRVQRRIERLAIPPASLEDDPLRAILQNLVGLEDLPEDAVIRVEIDRAQGAVGPGTLAVFSLLWGQTLAEVASSSEEGTGLVFECAPELTAVSWPSIADPDDDTEGDDAWTHVPLCLVVAGEDAPRYRFRWGPDDIIGLAAMAALARGFEPPESDGYSLDLEEWCEALATAMLSEEPPGQVGAADPWQELRLEYFRQWATDGMSADSITEFIDRWTELLTEARAAMVPAGSPLPGLDDVLDLDIVRLAPDRAVMTAVHPIRLRWFGAHLRRFQGYLQAALDQDFVLNPENDSLYFDRLRKVSPHRQPPIIVIDAEKPLASTREFGFHEEYGEISAGGGAETWIGAVDDVAIEELVGTVGSYLDSFPQKADGLGVLVLSESGDERLGERLLKGINKRFSDIVLDVHIVAPLHTHRPLVTRIGEGSHDDRDGSDRLLPSIRVVVHEWPDDWDELLSSLDGAIDVAIVPNLFGAQTRLQQETRPAELGAAGSFDPWLDRTVHTLPPAEDAGENVSQVLLPADPDPISEAWSTLSVRRYRRSPVMPDSRENTDYFTLQVTFDRRKDLFDRLHDVAHWVATLDPFVGRDQIDALESPPDVIIVKTNLGKNRTHTLVVSSRSGRRFVAQGLKRQLLANLGLGSEHTAALTAERVYDIGRNTVPGTILRALGLGRTLEEIVGLVVTRFVVERDYAKADGCRLQWWISLDDHLPWFGGMRPLRADLLRVQMEGDREHPVLRLQIIESKFRQTADIGSAEDQLERTKSLLGAAFQPAIDGEVVYKDGEFWRRELAAALDETSRRGVSDEDLPPLWTADGGSAIEDLRSILGDASYDFEIETLVCALATEVDDPATATTTPRGLPLLSLNRPEIHAALAEIRDGSWTGSVVVADPDNEADSPEPESEHQPEVGNAPSAAEAPGPPSPEVDPAAVDPPGHERQVSDRSADGLSSAELEARYQRVLDAFNEFNVQVTRANENAVEQGPAFYRVRVVTGPGIPADRVTSRAAELKLRLELPAELNLRSYLDRGAVVFEIPKREEERYNVLADEMWAKFDPTDGALEVPVGEDISGDVVSIDFSSSETPHLLLAGTTGSGKSVALETILRGLCRRFGPDRLHLQLVDPKGTELLDFEDDPHLRGGIGMDAEDAVSILESAVEEMQARYAIFKGDRVRHLAEFNEQAEPERRIPWRMLVLDEYADLTSDPQEKKMIEALLKRLSQKARAAGIHLIVATQRPSADVISSVVRSNLPAQLALRVRDANDSRVILGESGAEALAGSGDAFLRTQRGLTRIQCALTSAPDGG